VAFPRKCGLKKAQNMDHEPKFSVVIPTYNRLGFLKDALDSVWKQTFTDYEVIVVDDGSTDGTKDYLQGLGNKVRFVCQANRGPGAARNAGVRAARGEYVAFLDSDDLWFPWTLSSFAHAIEEFGCPHIISGRYIEFTNEKELSNIQNEPYRASYFSDYFASSHHSWSVGSGTCALRRESLAAKSFLEDRFNAEDHDLLLRLGTVPGFVQILAPTTVAWRRHPESATGDFAKTVAGAMRLLARERSGAYPGRQKRCRERQRIIARHIRPIALECIRRGALRQGWDLYLSTFGWSVKLGHWKYLMGFPVLAVLTLLNRAITGGSRPA
jgi:glycosyltransferase involved in cell wall biosynthesis